jgi:tripartite motif-containing protein 71
MKTAVRVFLVSVCLWVVCTSPPAFSEEAYKFELMWPKLEQPWYFFNLVSVAADLSENVYVVESGGPYSESWSRVQKFSKDGNFITKWGSNGSGDGQFSSTGGVAVDSFGSVYVDDTGNDRIQKFDSNGNFITKWGSKGQEDGQFDHPSGVAVDSSGHVYVADNRNNRIQKFDSNGNFITKWGSYGNGNGQFWQPAGVAVDASGNFYVADTLNDRIQKFDSSGNIIIKWGSGGSGDGQFYRPTGIAVDSSGYVYIADNSNSRIQKFDSDGRFITKSQEPLTDPHGVAVDSFGYVYVAIDDLIQKYDSYLNVVTKWASYGSGDGHFNVPTRVAVDPAGYVYVADRENHRIQKFDSGGIFVTKWGSFGSGDGQFGFPHRIAADSAGHVYVMDNRIQKFDSVGRFITKWGLAWCPDLRLQDIAVASSGHVYVATFCMPYTDPVLPRDCYVWKFDSDGNFITKWGSCGTGDGQFNSADAVAVDASGYVYVAGDYRIQKFDSNGNFVGKWGSRGSGDGQFFDPLGVAVDSSGNVYVTEEASNRVQKFDSNGQFVTKWGSMGSDEGQFLHPAGVAVDPLGNVYVADTDNHRIQKFSPAGQETISTPTAPSGPVGGIVGPEYIFSTGGATSDLAHPVEYRFSWGDGTYSDWSASPVASKSWPSPGAYSVKAQARCSIDTSVGSNWSAGLTVNIASTIILESPVEEHHFSACSLYALPSFSWSVLEAFNGYQLQFSLVSGFWTVEVSVPISDTGITMPLATWTKILLIPGLFEGNVYWRVVGNRADGSTGTSEVGSFVIDGRRPGNPTIAPTGRRSKPTLTWQTNCNTKFKVWFGSDSGFTKKTYSFEVGNPSGTEGTISNTLTALQWVRIKLLVKNKKGSTIYWFIESWDELGRYAKTDVMSFVLTD